MNTVINICWCILFFITNTVANIPLDFVNRRFYLAIALNRLYRYRGTYGPVLSKYPATRSQSEQNSKLFTDYSCRRILDSFRGYVPRVLITAPVESFVSTWPLMSRDTKVSVCMSLEKMIEANKRSLVKLEPIFVRADAVRTFYVGIISEMDQMEKHEIEKFKHDMLMEVEEFDRFDSTLKLINRILYDFAHLPKDADTTIEGHVIWPIEESEDQFRTLVADVILEDTAEKIQIFVYKLSTQWTREKILTMADSVLEAFNLRRDEMETKIRKLENRLVFYYKPESAATL